MALKNVHVASHHYSTHVDTGVLQSVWDMSVIVRSFASKPQFSLNHFLDLTVYSYSNLYLCYCSYLVHRVVMLQLQLVVGVTVIRLSRAVFAALLAWSTPH
jgi:ferredoxin-fold anticodon binding domain-containing protein